MSKGKVLCGVVAMFLLLAIPVNANLLVDGSFEDPVTATNFYGSTYWSGLFFTVNAANSESLAQINDAGQVDGSNFAQIPGTVQAGQHTGITLVEGMQIDFSAMIGRFTESVGVGYAGYALALAGYSEDTGVYTLIDDSVSSNEVTPAPGDFVQASMSYTVTAADPVGQELWVTIVG